MVTRESWHHPPVHFRIGQRCRTKPWFGNSASYLNIKGSFLSPRKTWVQRGIEPCKARTRARENDMQRWRDRDNLAYGLWREFMSSSSSSLTPFFKISTTIRIVSRSAMLFLSQKWILGFFLVVTLSLVTFHFSKHIKHNDFLLCVL